MYNHQLRFTYLRIRNSIRYLVAIVCPLFVVPVGRIRRMALHARELKAKILQKPGRTSCIRRWVPKTINLCRLGA